jgi:hypothetical protein
MKTSLHVGPRGSQRDRVAPDTEPVTGSISYQEPSTIRGEAHIGTPWIEADRCGSPMGSGCRSGASLRANTVGERISAVCRRTLRSTTSSPGHVASCLRLSTAPD